MQQRIAEVPSTHPLGPLLLDMGPLKIALRAECIHAKGRFAGALHARAAVGLRALDGALQEATARVSRPLQDVEDLQVVSEALQGVWEREASFEREAGPLEEVYALLAKHDVRVPKEEMDMVFFWKGGRGYTCEGGGGNMDQECALVFVQALYV